MARKLKTGWVVLATSGSVVDGKTDGRFMKKEWLTEMVESFNTKVFTPKLWPEHRRYYSAGTVMALKVEPATEPELKGELQLFGILAPSDWLVRANREGDYTFPSIEVGENFRGTGKYFLRGLGVTDSPASAGVTELEFSSQDGNESAHIVSGHQFNLAEEIQPENNNLLKRVFSKLGDNTTPKPDTETDTMTPEQLAQLQSDLTASMQEQFCALAGKLTPKAEEGEAPEVVTAEQFSALQEENTSLKGRLETLETQFAELKQTPAGGTDTPEGEGDAKVPVI